MIHHIERLDAIATSCGSATPWQSLNRLPVGYITESDTSAKSARRTILSAGSVFFFRGLLLVSYDLQLSHFVG